MTDWLRLDSAFARHRKVRRLSDAAFRLHVSALCRVADDETDGLVTAEDLSDAATDARQPERKLPALVDELVTRGLWDEVLGGDAWLVHDYLDKNPSHDDLEAGRRATRERVQKWRRAKAEREDAEREAAGQGTLDGAGNGVTNGVRNASRNGATVRNGTKRDVSTTRGAPSSSTEPEQPRLLDDPADARALADLQAGLNGDDDAGFGGTPWRR